MKVRDVMLSDVPVARLDDSLRAAAEMLYERHVNVLPVCEGARLVGVVTDWDVICALADGGDPDSELVQNYMSANVLAVTPDTPTETAGELMAHRRIHHLLVCDEDRFAGIVHIDVEWAQLGGPGGPRATFAATPRAW